MCIYVIAVVSLTFYDEDGASTIAASEPSVVLVQATFAYNAAIRDFLDQWYDTVCIRTFSCHGASCAAKL